MMPEAIKSESILKLWGKIFADTEKTEPKDVELLKMIDDVKDEINLCRRNFEFCDNDTLTDMYIYAIKANELRYANLLRIAKKQYEEGLI